MPRQKEQPRRTGGNDARELRWPWPAREEAEPARQDAAGHSEPAGHAVLAAVYPPGWLVGGQGAREGVLEGLREGRRVGEDLVGQRRPSSWIREEMLDRCCSLF